MLLIDLLKCAGCGVFVTDVEPATGECEECCGVSEFYDPSAVGTCLVEEQDGEPCGATCARCGGPCEAGHPVVWYGPVGEGYCSDQCVTEEG